MKKQNNSVNTLQVIPKIKRKNQTRAVMKHTKTSGLQGTTEE